MKNLQLIGLAIMLPFFLNAQTSTLISRSNRSLASGTPVIIDSTHYHYTYPFWGDLTHPLNFDTAITYVGSTAVPQTLITTHFYMGVPDSTKEYNIPSSGSLSLLKKYYYFYYSAFEVKNIIVMKQSSTGGLIVDYQDYFYYTTSSNLYRHIRSSWNGAGFSPNLQRHFTFTTIVNNGHQQFDEDHLFGTYLNFNKYFFTYPSANKEEAHYSININATISDTEWHYQYQYDGSGNMVTRTVNRKDSASGIWTAFSKSSFSSYSMPGCPALENCQMYDTITAAWVNCRQYNYLYNSMGQTTQRSSQTWLPSSSTWAYTTADTLSNYYYGPAATPMATQTINQSKLIVYPNPVSELITVEYGTSHLVSYSIYDCTGRIVIQGECRSMNTISVSGWPPGFYVFKAQYTDGAIAQQLFEVL